MGILDYFRRRLRKRVGRTGQARSYQAAAQDRLLANFLARSLSADSEIRPALRVLRARSRELARNDDYVRRYLHLLKTNVVGPNGIKLQSRVRISGGRDDGQLDENANTAIEAAWKEWGKKGSPTADGRLSWLGVQRLAIENLAKDGEVLIQKLARPRSHPFGFTLKFLDPERLDVDYNLILANGNQVRMGVELNADGRPVAYHIFDEHPHDGNFTSHGRRLRRRMPADEIIHIYDQTDVEQTRGIPWVHTAAKRLHHLEGYEEAELIAARVAAAKMGFLLTEDGADYTGEDEDPDDGATIMEAKPGTMEKLPPGVKFEGWDPTHPTSAFPEFVKAALRGAASGLNTSFASLSNNLESVSFSSIRQGALEDRDNYRALQALLIENLHDCVAPDWLRWSITTGKVKLPMRDFDRFAAGQMWQSRGWQWIDPQKEMQANVIGLKNGVLTLQDIAAETGRDVEDTAAQLAREDELFAKHGLVLAFQPFGADAGRGQAPAEPADDASQESEEI